MKINSIVFIMIYFITMNLYSQQETIKATQPSENISIPDQKPCIYTLKLIYPELAKNNKISGTVIISCDIDTTCSCVNRKIVSGLGYGCDEAALNALDQFEANQKRCYSSICKPEKNVRIPIKFKL